jgi:hypothetical protein
VAPTADTAARPPIRVSPAQPSELCLSLRERNPHATVPLRTNTSRLATAGGLLHPSGDPAVDATQRSVVGRPAPSGLALPEGEGAVDNPGGRRLLNVQSLRCQQAVADRESRTSGRAPRP